MKTFPQDFEFGAATSSYQIEGAWNVDGKGWSMWDHLVRTTPEHIVDMTNGDTAAKSYFFYKRDVEMLKELGVKNYRFSISWPRILPYGRPDYVNPYGVAYYECSRNILLAHARAYRIYEAEFKSTQRGEVGFVTCMEWGVAESNSTNDKDALENFQALTIGQHMNPIFSESGNFPQKLIDLVNSSSIRQGLNESRLRPFTQEQIESIRGSADFLGLNHYTSRIIYRNESLNGTFPVPSIYDDTFYGDYPHPSWFFHGGYVYEYPRGFYDLLIHLKDNYNIPKIYITENGAPSLRGEGRLNDTHRVRYFREYLSAMIDAIDEGVNVRGHFAWSLMDNFEWTLGYT
ncbi:Cytosolic beta-glucosidase [Papilio xuthus]|uniref:Cytosolic beta-glucosidase n=1 Tax=Papilio xuthus TaxID=66420 RepID=A0A194QIG7_PAPXU|nr:Cytosolic beta-glucosidase [Papilio xuthus]